MYTESVEDWLMISWRIFQPTSRRRYFKHVAHHCLHDRRPVTHFLLSTRSDDENYDVGTILHQCCWEPIVRVLIETIVCIKNAFKARSSAFGSCQKLPRVYQSYRESSQHLLRHFLHYDIIPLKVPFRLTGHIYIYIYARKQETRC